MSLNNIRVLGNLSKSLIKFGKEINPNGSQVNQQQKVSQGIVSQQEPKDNIIYDVFFTNRNLNISELEQDYINGYFSEGSSKPQAKKTTK